MHAHPYINITNHSNPCLITIIQWHPTFCVQIHPKFTEIIMRCVDFNSCHMLVCIDFNKTWTLHSHWMCRFQHLACVNSNKPWAGNSQNTACSLQLTECHCIIACTPLHTGVWFGTLNGLSSLPNVFPYYNMQTHYNNAHNKPNNEWKYISQSVNSTSQQQKCYISLIYSYS